MALIDPITDYAPALISDPGETLADAFESASPIGAKRPTNILDPGFDLTLRPMRYPQFFEMYRDAIKNTWTVEEIDFSDDLVDLDRKLMPGRAAPRRTSGGVLRHRRLDRVEQPGAQPVPAHQRPRSPDVPVAPALRRGAARAVLPDAARHLHPRHGRARRRRSPRSRTSRRSAPRPSSASSGSTRSRACTRIETARGAQAVPAQPDLLRRLHRGSVLLRRLRLRLLPAFEGPA